MFQRKSLIASFTGLLGVILLGLGASFASAQTNIHISGAQAGFPVAIPQLCNAGGAADIVNQLPEVVTKNLQISGLFKVLDPKTFVETPGKCIAPEEVGYSDWSIIGAEGLVRGEVSVEGNRVLLKMYLHDVLQKRVVVGKRYEASKDNVRTLAHRFSNEILRYFTGQEGIFGTKIAFVSKVGRFKELFVMGLDGSERKQLTSDKGLALSPSWSPRGEKIVFTSFKTRRPELYTVSPKGGNVQRITKRPGLELGAKFSPDGTSLLSAASVAGVSKIAMLDLRGRILRRLTGGSYIDVSPTWSPDGSKFAYCSNRAGGPQIYVQDVIGGGKAQRISYADSSYCTSPAWSPTGDKIAFVCRQKGNHIYVAPVGGGQLARLTFSGNNEDPAWSPDGRFLAFSSNLGQRKKRSLVVLSLLGGSPTQLTDAVIEDSQPAWSPVLE